MDSLTRRKADGADISSLLLARLSDFVETRMGLHFPAARLGDLKRGICSAAGEFGFKNVESCIEWLLSSVLSGSQIKILAGHLTVGETYFFREKRIFEILEAHVLPEIIDSRRGREQNLRIWSAACSTGEEPYSVAILLARILPDLKDWNSTILATDIAPLSLQKASAGVYREWSFRDTPRWVKDGYFKRIQQQFEIANSIINGGVYAAWDSKFHYRQNLNLGDDSPKQHAEDTVKGGDYYNLPELVEIMAKGAEPALNWMIDEGGAQVRQTVTRAGGHTAYRTHSAVAGVGREYTEALRKIGEKRGAKIVLNSEVTWIWRKDVDPESPVLGLEVKRGRKTLNIKAQKAVILASGGFSRDLKMRLAHNPRLVDSFNCTNQPGATGEIIRFAQYVGADTLQMNFIQLYPFAEPETGILDTPAVYPFNGPGYGIVYVTKAGKRFVNELERRDVCAFAQINLGGDAKPTFSIFNEGMVLKMGGSNEEVAAGIAKGRFIKAETISELAGKLNIPADALTATVDKHNKYIEEGKDPDFNKSMTKVMIPLTKGPFYAVAQWPAVHHCMGGLRINPQAQVVDIFGNVIPGLYAAGEVAGGVHGSNRLGSNAIPDAVSFGRVAGTNSAKEKPKA